MGCLCAYWPAIGGWAAAGRGVLGTGSCGVAHCGKGLIAIFRNFYASISEILILAEVMSTRRSFYEVKTSATCDATRVYHVYK